MASKNGGYKRGSMNPRHDHADRRPSMIGDGLDKTFTKISISEAEALARKANAAKMAKIAKKKHFVAQEMIDTEKKYVDSLKRIVGNYYRPLLSACGTDRQILDRREIKTIFSNMEQLLLLNVELLADLEKEGPDGDIGGVFMRIAPFLKMYHVYLDQAEDAGKAVRKRIMRDASMVELKATSGNKFDLMDSKQKKISFRAFCKRMALETGEQLQSLLIKPVQRIPRYRMLLEQLIKYTPEKHSDHARLKKALQSVLVTASHVNQSIRDKQEKLEIMHLHQRFKDLGLPPEQRFGMRKLMFEGTMTKYDQHSSSFFGPGSSKRDFFLFSDGLAYCDKSAISGQLSLKLWFPLFYLSVGEVAGQNKLMRISGVAVPPNLIEPLLKPGRRLSEEYTKGELEPHQTSLLVEATNAQEWVRNFRHAFNMTGKVSSTGHQIFFRALSQRALLKEKLKLESRTRSVSVANSDNVVKQALHRLNGHRRITTAEEMGASVAKPRFWDLTDNAAAPVCLEGNLKKLARVSQRNWKTRYFKLLAPFYTTYEALKERKAITKHESVVLEHSKEGQNRVLCGMLVYYSDMFSTKAKGFLRIGANSTVKGSLKGGKPCVFEITCENGERLYLQAENTNLVMQWRNAIDDVIMKTVNAVISRRVKELTRENTGSDRALSLAREMVKQADGLPSSLPPPPKGVFTTPESKASSLLATAKALQSRTEFGAASILFQKACQLSASTTGDRSLRTKDPALGFRCLLCYAQCYAAWLKVALTVAVRETGQPVRDSAMACLIPGSDGQPLVVVTTDDTLRLANIAEELYGSALVELALVSPALKKKPREYPARRIRRWIATAVHALGALYSWINEQEMNLALLRLSHAPPSDPMIAARKVNSMCQEYLGRCLESLSSIGSDDVAPVFHGSRHRRDSSSSSSSSRRLRSVSGISPQTSFESTESLQKQSNRDVMMSKSSSKRAAHLESTGSTVRNLPTNKRAFHTQISMDIKIQKDKKPPPRAMAKPISIPHANGAEILLDAISPIPRMDRVDRN